MARFAARDRALCGPIAALALLSTGCPRPPPRVESPTAACEPACVSEKSCHTLDDRLVAARQPLLRCIREAARGGVLDRAHRCYRALRLLESARWWLRTLRSDNAALPSIYREPVETVRLEFLCRIERLARARTPSQVQRRYLEMIRSYP